MVLLHIGVVAVGLALVQVFLGVHTEVVAVVLMIRRCPVVYLTAVMVLQV
jgi:hypothetical protein